MMPRPIRNSEIPPSADYQKGYRHGKQDAAEAWRSLYDAINEVVAVIGCHGQIISKDDRVAWLMRCLDIIDGGNFKAAAPAQTALTDAARDAARWRMAVEIGAINAGFIEWTDAALTAAQSASGDTPNQ
ncbi:hypothetical protein [Paraburkholderia caledonica]|uniref:hypothetical protein n=1 Tax=Paraburkholderia caledonica TaxID=134536 RepID=UPI0038BCCBA7